MIYMVISYLEYILLNKLNRSGTKPNLVAKMLATNFGFVPDC